MRNMKRTIFSVIFVALATLCAQAQNPFSSILSDCKVVAVSNEQGRDRLDSTNCLQTQVYAVPYKGKKAVAKAEAIIKEIVDCYNKQIGHYTGGFCFSGKLDVHSPAESQKVSASYSEDAAPFVVGGVGRNYALLRQLDPKNPHYRTVYGVEWWLLEKPRVVYFKTFRLFGPLMARSNPKYILGQTDSMKDFLDTFRSSDWQNKKFDMFGKADSLKLDMLGKINPLKHADDVAWYLGKVCDLYKGDGSAMDSGVVSVAVRRFMNYMSESNVWKTDEGVVRVLRAFRLPGCYAEVNGKVVEHGDMQWLASRWKDLHISRVSYVEKGDPECQKYGEKSKNFLFRVYLTQ